MKKTTIIVITILIIALASLGMWALWRFNREGKIVPAEDGSAYYFINTDGELVSDIPFASYCRGSDNNFLHVEFYQIENGKPQKKYGYADNSFNLIKDMSWNTDEDHEWCKIGNGYVLEVDELPTKTLKILDYNLNTMATVNDVEISSIYDCYISDADIISVRASNGLWGAINTEGEWIIEPKYKELSRFQDGYVGACEDELWGVLDTNGNWVLEPQFYGYISPNNSYFSVEIKDTPDADRKTIFINVKGERLNNEEYCGVYSGYRFSEGLMYVATGDKENHLVGYIDESGEYVIEPKYFWASDFHQGLAAVQKKIDGQYKWAYIDKNGKNITDFEFDDVGDFSSEGYAAVEVDGKWGYIKTDGTWFLEPQFDDESSFSCGYATVKLEKGQKIKK
ncbi:WG repeat-containing protein [Pseudobutyrivibrio sp.]